MCVGIFKLLCAPLCEAVRRRVPRAGLLGSLAGVALALIAFVPLWQQLAAAPLVGLPSLAVLLFTLVTRQPLPGRFPGALAAVLVGTVVYHLLDVLGRAQGWPLVLPQSQVRDLGWTMPDLFPLLDWDEVFPVALAKLPYMLPFAIATVVGGIDCTESAAAAGDDYDTRLILLSAVACAPGRRPTYPGCTPLWSS